MSLLTVYYNCILFQLLYHIIVTAYYCTVLLELHIIVTCVSSPHVNFLIVPFSIYHCITVALTVTITLSIVLLYICLILSFTSFTH